MSEECQKCLGTPCQCAFSDAVIKAGGQSSLAAMTGYVSTFIGKKVIFQDEGEGIIDGEDVDRIHITSKFFTGWMFKAEYFDLLGIET